MGMSVRFFPCYCPIYGVQYTIAKNYTFCKTGIREYCLVYVVRFVLEIY